jgi:hypothetical protein
MSELDAGLIPHETITVNIGEGAYRFRTLSIKQIFTCQPELREMRKQLASKTREEISAMTPDDEAVVVAAQRRLLGSICPLLIQIKTACVVDGCDTTEPHADYLHLTGDALTDIIRFYMRQDWAKLGEMLSIGEDSTKPKDPGESERTFRTVGRVVAKAYNQSFDDFINLRFEEAASRVIEIARTWEEKDSRGKTSLADFFDMMAGSMGMTTVEGDAPVQTVAPDADISVLTSPPEN